MNSIFFYSVMTVILLLLTGLYFLLLAKNLIRILISLEILMKAVTLFIIAAGYVMGQEAFMQSLAVTLIIIEVVSVAVAAGIVIGIFRRQNTLDTSDMENSKE